MDSQTTLLLVEKVAALEKEVAELRETLYNMLGIHADELEPQSATKIANEAWDKWAEANVGKFERRNILTKEELYNQMKVTQIDPVEAEYYRQMDKAIKDTKE